MRGIWGHLAAAPEGRHAVGVAALLRRWGGRRDNEGLKKKTGENESAGLSVVRNGRWNFEVSAEGNEGQVVVSNAMPE